MAVDFEAEARRRKAAAIARILRQAGTEAADLDEAAFDEAAFDDAAWLAAANLAGYRTVSPTTRRLVRSMLTVADTNPLPAGPFAGLLVGWS